MKIAPTTTNTNCAIALFRNIATFLISVNFNDWTGEEFQGIVWNGDDHYKIAVILTV